MVRFDRDDTRVIAKIDSTLVGNVYYPFTWNGNSAEHAELLKRYFQDMLNEKLEAIRRCAYEEGYADGRRHHLKKRTFLTGFNPDQIGY